MPISEANTPIPIMRATGCFSPSILGSVSGGPLASSVLNALPLRHGARVYWLVKTGMPRAPWPGAAYAASRPAERRKLDGGSPW